MALSAADFNKRLNTLEGAPGPSPTEEDGIPSKIRAHQETLDADSQTDFPSLVSSIPVTTAATKAAWGADTGPRLKANIWSRPVVSDSFDLTSIALPATKDGKPISLGEIMKQVMSKFKVKIEASANQKARQTTFHIKAGSEKELENAKRHLLSLLSPVVSVDVLAPASTIGAIIGPKGATLKQIRDQTGVKVDIPARIAGAANGRGHETPNGTTTPVKGDDEDEPMVTVMISGPQPLAVEARAMINEIIYTRTSRTTRRVKNIPPHILPFVDHFLAATRNGDIELLLKDAECEVTVIGDRETVMRIVDELKGMIETCQTELTEVKLSLPKRQHRLLLGQALKDIFDKSHCSVLIPDTEDPSEVVTVYGKPMDCSSGLATVMEVANSQYIHVFPLPGPITLSRQLLAYMTHINYTETLNNAHPRASVFTPSFAMAVQSSVINIDIVGEKSIVDDVVKQVSELLGKLIGATKEVNVNWLSHHVIQARNAKKLQEFHDVHNVQVFFPPESVQQSSVLLVYDPFSPKASRSPVEKEKHLTEVSEVLLKMASEAADIKTETIRIEKRWHKDLVDQGGSVLDLIAGEDRALSVKFGTEVDDSLTEDVIRLRGITSDVDAAVQTIQRIVKVAEEDAIASSYFTELEIDKEFVGRVVGTHWASLERLKGQFNVKVDIIYDSEDKEKEKGLPKKKLASHNKVKFKITGRKEEAEKAKNRILMQVERMADETFEIIKIPSKYHAALIGPSGKYVIRLENNYQVKINFPRQSDVGEGKREQLKLDEILIKGCKKGVTSARHELLEAFEVEKESDNALEFTVPSRAVPRIVGKGGASIGQIKSDTGAEIILGDNTGDKNLEMYITVRGTKEAVKAAKAAILAIADQVPEEVTETIFIEQKYHGSIIGFGRQGLKDIITQCGGPPDILGLIKFPRQGEASDEVRIRGEATLVSKVKDELEKKAALLRDKVVLAVEIPAAQHRNFIGRGGQLLRRMQVDYGVEIQFPKSRGYDRMGEPSNMDEMENPNPDDVVKVGGLRSDCEKAIEGIRSQIKAPAAESPTATVLVPLKYHGAVLKHVRTLRSLGAHYEHSGQTTFALPTQPPRPVDLDARIDETPLEPQVDWQITFNYQDAQEGDCEWMLRANGASGLERAQSEIQLAIEKAQEKSHTGFLTLSDRSVFPRLVGTKGANVARLRNETGADITISRESNTIVIIGSEPVLEAAKEAILAQAASSPRERRR